MIYYKNAVPELLKLRQSSAYRQDHIYFPEVAAFDIETTRFQNVAFMYIWQFGIGVDLTVYGRTWKDFTDFLYMLQDELQLSPDFKLLIMIHDLRYEFGFFRKLLWIDEGSLIARTQRQIIRFTSGCFEFRDSYTYTEQPLKQLGKEVGIPKLDYDYSEIRLPITPLSDKELSYCENDVRILTEYFMREVNQYKNVSRLPLTLTQRVNRVISSNMAKDCTKQQRFQLAARQLDAEEDRVLLNYLRVAYFGGFNYATQFYRSDVLDNVHGADIDTSYVSQILFHRFPATKFKKLENFQAFTVAGGAYHAELDAIVNARKRYNGQALLIRIQCEGLEAKIPELAFLPIYPKNYLGRAPEARRRMKTEHVASCDYVDTVLTDIDFRLMIKWYNFRKLTVSEIFTSRYMPLPEYVLKSAAELAARKKAMKDYLTHIKSHRAPTVQEVAEYVRIKSMCARIYGVFVKDPIRMQYAFDPESGNVIPAGLTGIEEAELDINGEKRKNFAPTMYQWGVWVASWARKAELDMAYKIATYSPIPQPDGFFNRSVIYCDTDSVYWYDNPAAEDLIKEWNAGMKYRLMKLFEKYDPEVNWNGITPEMLKGIGEFRIDHYSKFKVLGLKQYAFIDHAGQFQYHISGLPQPEWNDAGELIKGKYFDQFETATEKLAAVTEDLKIPAQLTGTLKSRYIDHEEECCVTDRFGNCMNIKIPSCIILEPQAFKASVSPLEEIQELIAGIDPDKFEAVLERNLPKKGKVKNDH